MKRIRKLNLQAALFVLLMSVAIMPAFAVTIDGIEYTLDSKTKEAKVKNGADFRGDLSIPETITADGEVYTVTSIGKCAFGANKRLTSVIKFNEPKSCKEPRTGHDTVGA